MIIKKQGKVNEIVYQYTVYNDGQNRYYPTINDLVFLIKKLLKLMIQRNTLELIHFM